MEHPPVRVSCRTFYTPYRVRLYSILPFIRVRFVRFYPFSEFDSFGFTLLYASDCSDFTPVLRLQSVWKCVEFRFALVCDIVRHLHLLSVYDLYDFLYFYRLTTAKGVYLVRVRLPHCYFTVICLFHTC